MTREEKGVGAKPGKFGESHLFHVRNTPIVVQRGHYKKGTLVHLLKMAQTLKTP